jgi:hypothetical protein
MYKDIKMHATQNEIKEREKQKQNPVEVMKHSQQLHSNHHRKQHPDYKKKISKSNTSKNEIMHKLCHHPIENLGFSPWRKCEFTKQYLQQAIARYNQ